MRGERLVRIPYNPRWQTSISCLGFGLALLAVAHFSGRHSWIFTVSGIILTLLGGLLLLRRHVCPRFIEVDETSILIPSGFLRVFPRRLAFTDIVSFREGASLTLRSRIKSFEILADFLPNVAAYTAIKNYISDWLPASYERVDGSGFVAYRFRNTDFGKGEVYDSTGSLVMSYHPPGGVSNALNWFTRSPRFILKSPDGQEILRICRVGFLSLRRFEIMVGDRHIGTVDSKSLFHTKYSVHFFNNINWSFEIPISPLK
jgi:hypothetical protein